MHCVFIHVNFLQLTEAHFCNVIVLQISRADKHARGRDHLLKHVLNAVKGCIFNPNQVFPKPDLSVFIL